MKTRICMVFLAVLMMVFFGGSAFGQMQMDDEGEDADLSKAPDSQVVDRVECRVEKRDGDVWQYYIITKDGTEMKMRKTWPPKFSWDASSQGPSEGRPIVTGRHMNKIVFSSPGELGAFMHHGGVNDCVPSTHEHSH